MIFISDANGTIKQCLPTDINQGSNYANEIVLLSPIGASALVQITLPNGVKLNPRMMVTVLSEDNMYIYRTVLDKAVTQYSGQLRVSFIITNSTKESTTEINTEGAEVTTEGTQEITTSECFVKINRAGTWSRESLAVTAENEVALATLANAVTAAVQSRDNAYTYAVRAQAYANGTVPTLVENDKGEFVPGADEPVGTQDYGYNANAKYYKDIAEGWAVGTCAGKPVEKTSDFHENNAKYYADLISSMIGSINISFDRESDTLTLSYASEGKTHSETIDLELEKLITEVDDYINKEDGKRYLKITYKDGKTTEIELNEIFEGFVKQTNKNNRLYGTDESGNQHEYEISQEITENAVVQRDEGGYITVPDDAYEAKKEPFLNLSTGKMEILEVAIKGSKHNAINVKYLETRLGDYLKLDGVDSALESSNIFNTALAEKVDNYKYDELKTRVAYLEGAMLEYIGDGIMAYIKTVPTGVGKYAIINKIGGMSYKSKNLLSTPYRDTNKTERGITFTVNADYSITVNGQNDGTGDASFALSDITLPEGRYTNSGNISLIIKGNRTGESSITYEGVGIGATALIEKGMDGYVYFKIRATDKTVYNNYIIKPMLNLSENRVILPWEPYFEGIRDAKVTAVKSVGADGIIDNFAIPQKVQELEGYGQGNPDNAEEYNYIDFENKEFVACGHIVNGAWEAYDKPDITNISADLTDYDDYKFIKTEQGGYIVFENEHQYKVPSVISYVS